MPEPTTAEVIDLLDQLLDDATEDLDSIQKCSAPDDPDTVQVKAELDSKITILEYLRTLVTN